MNPYNKVTGCVFVCLYRRISLTAEPSWFSFTGKLLIGPGNVFNYFWGGYYHPPKRNYKKKSKKFKYLRHLNAT